MNTDLITGTPSKEPALGMPPPPADTGEMLRIEESRRRRRIMYSSHWWDVSRLIQMSVGSIRQQAWGYPDLTSNPALAMWSQAAASYNAQPTVYAPAPSKPLIEDVANAGLWSLMQRIQRDTLGFREMLLRVDVDPSSDNEVTFRPVYPDMVEARAHPYRPGVPVRVAEWAEHPHYGWLRYICDVSDPEKPSYTVETKDGDDISRAVLNGDFTGQNYPYRKADGAPIMPYVMYHASETGMLFDPFTFGELFNGTLQVCVGMTFWMHILRDAAWAQRYMVGMSPKGANIEGTDVSARAQVVTDPATVLALDVDEGVTNPLIGSWMTSADPEKVLASICAYEKRLLTIAGFGSAEVTRNSADVRSGYSLAVAREDIRAQQRVFEPLFRRSDAVTLATAAVVSNRFRGTTYSETPSDYRIAYNGLPLTPDEAEALRKSVEAEEQAGRIGPLTAFQRIHPEATQEAALEALTQAARERLVVSTALAEYAPPPPPPPPSPATPSTAGAEPIIEEPA